MYKENAKVGESLPADKIKGRVKNLEPVYTAKPAFKGDKPDQDQNDGTWWLIEVHVPEMFTGHYRIPAGSKMPKISQFNVTSAIIVGNEDCPDEIWLTIGSPVLYYSKFWRVK